MIRIITTDGHDLLRASPIFPFVYVIPDAGRLVCGVPGSFECVFHCVRCRHFGIEKVLERGDTGGLRRDTTEKLW